MAATLRLGKLTPEGGNSLRRIKAARRIREQQFADALEWIRDGICANYPR